MKAGHICTCKSFVQQKLECNVNKVRGWVSPLLFLMLFIYFSSEQCSGEMEPSGWKPSSLLPASPLRK